MTKSGQSDVKATALKMAACYVGYHRHELVEKLQRKYAYSEEEATKLTDLFMAWFMELAEAIYEEL